MKKNIINFYMDFKVNYLVKYALLFFEKDKKDDFLKKSLERYFNTYINFYFYHKLEVLDKCELYDFSNLEKEFEGIEIELLDDYSAFELIDTNEGYKYNQKLIKAAKEICFNLCKFDQVDFQSKEVIGEVTSKYVLNSEFLNLYIGNNLDKFISLVKDVYNKENKFFMDKEEFFCSKYKKINGSNDLFLVKLVPNIKMLEVNYKQILIDRVFGDNKLNKDKMSILIQKLSKDILRKIIRKENVDTYLVYIPDNLFYRNKLILDEVFSNDLIKRYVVLLTTFTTYTSRKHFFENNRDFRYACLQDFLHINDVVNKLNVIDGEGVFEYIVIDDYKFKDKEDIEKYECSNALGLFIDKEV